MTYRVTFTKEVDKTLAKWGKSNPILRKKCDKMIIELAQHPRTGLGHPEPLVAMGDFAWSRRIDKHNRMVYKVYDEVVTVLIISVEGHYDDK